MRVFAVDLAVCGLCRPFMPVRASDSLLHAARLMHARHLHRVCVVDEHSHNPLGILTSERILRYLLSHCAGTPCLPLPKIFEHRPRTLGIGAWTPTLYTVTLATPLVDCLHMLIKRDISGVPVLHNDRVVDVYSRFDIISLVYNDAVHTLHELNMQSALALKVRAYAHVTRARTGIVATCVSSISFVLY
jgi:CBS domain-containing protein